jgi:hypothetical protein
MTFVCAFLRTFAAGLAVVSFASPCGAEVKKPRIVWMEKISEKYFLVEEHPSTQNLILRLQELRRDVAESGVLFESSDVELIDQSPLHVCQAKPGAVLAMQDFEGALIFCRPEGKKKRSSDFRPVDYYRLEKVDWEKAIKKNKLKRLVLCARNQNFHGFVDRKPTEAGPR